MHLAPIHALTRKWIENSPDTQSHAMLTDLLTNEEECVTSDLAALLHRLNTK